MAQDRHAEGAPVDAVMIVESPVFGRNDGAGERGRDVGESDPLQAPPRRVHAHLVDDAAVTVQEQGIGDACESRTSSKDGSSGPERYSPAARVHRKAAAPTKAAARANFQPCSGMRITGLFVCSVHSVCSVKSP